MPRRRLFLAFALCALVGTAPSANAATITVTTSADTINPFDGLVSLREAFNAASANQVNDTIVLSSGAQYTLTRCFPGELVHNPVVAQGSPPHELAVSGNGTTITQTCADTRVMKGEAKTVLRINAATIDGGPNPSHSVQGAAIQGTSFLTGVRVIGSQGASIIAGNGSSSDHVLTDTEVSGNDAPVAVHNFTGILSLLRSRVVQNTGIGLGGETMSAVTITDSTISRNGGAGYDVSGGLVGGPTIERSSFTNNADVGVRCGLCGRMEIRGGSVVARNGSGVGKVGGGVVAEMAGYTSSPGVTISDSGISENASSQPGGGLRVTGKANSSSSGALLRVGVSRSVIDGNRAPSGGGIDVAAGNLSVTESTISNNTAVGGNGGGIRFQDDPVNLFSTTFGLRVVGSTVVGNAAGTDGSGGGVYVASGSVAAEFANSTVTGNSAARGGGIAVASGPARADYVTLVQNTAGLGSNAATSGTGAFAVQRSIVARPAGTGANCFPVGGTISLGASFLSDFSCGSAPGDKLLIGGDPGLSALAANGGPTATMLPLPASPVIDLVALIGCTATDQRGTARPQGGRCDAGSVER